MTMHDRGHSTDSERLVKTSESLRIASEHLASFSESLRAEARYLRERGKSIYLTTVRTIDGE